MNSRQRKQDRKQRELAKLGLTSRQIMDSLEHQVLVSEARILELESQVKELGGEINNKNKWAEIMMDKNLDHVNRLIETHAKERQKLLSEVSGARTQVAILEKAVGTAQHEIEGLSARLIELGAAKSNLERMVADRDKKLAKFDAESNEKLRRRLQTKTGELAEAHAKIRELNQLLEFEKKGIRWTDNHEILPRLMKTEKALVKAIALLERVVEGRRENYDFGDTGDLEEFLREVRGDSAEKKASHG